MEVTNIQVAVGALKTFRAKTLEEIEIRRIKITDTSAFFRLVRIQDLGLNESDSNKKPNE